MKAGDMSSSRGDVIRCAVVGAQELNEAGDVVGAAIDRPARGRLCLEGHVREPAKKEPRFRGAKFIGRKAPKTTPNV